jgi:hypothetical protein
MPPKIEDSAVGKYPSGTTELPGGRSRELSVLELVDICSVGSSSGFFAG